MVKKPNQNKYLMLLNRQPIKEYWTHESSALVVGSFQKLYELLKSICFYKLFFNAIFNALKSFILKYYKNALR